MWNLSKQAGIADFASPGISKPAALNFLLLFVAGGWGGAPRPSLRHPLAFHRGTIVYFTSPLVKLDAALVALDMSYIRWEKKCYTGSF